MTASGELEAVPCTFCGEPTTSLGTRQCNRCWGVAGHIDSFVQSAAGRKRVLEALLKHQESESPLAPRKAARP